MNTLNIRNRELIYRASNLRQKGLVPGVLFGPNIKTKPIMTRSSDLIKAINKKGEVYEAPLKGEEYLVKIGEVQREPVTRKIIHFSLVQMPRGEMSQIDVPLELSGTPEGIKKGGNLVVLRPEIKIKGEPKRFPKVIKGSVKTLGIGDNLTIRDLKLPKNIEVLEDLDEVVAVCQPPVKEESAMATETLEETETMPPLVREESQAQARTS